MILSNYLKLAIEAALQAGIEIMRIYESAEFGVETKNDNTPLTVADKTSHKIISKALESSSLPLLSEEGFEIPFEQRSTWSNFWLVDPIDGTKEFIKRNGEFTVNIAMIHDGSPILGVVYAPVLRELFFAEKKLGSYKMTQIQTLEDFIKTIPTDLSAVTLQEVYTLILSKSHMNKGTQRYVDAKELTHGKINVVSFGSSLKICRVADGSAHCYPRFGPTMEWDTAAAHAVALFAGCRVTQGDEQSDLLYNKKSLLNPSFVIQR